MEMDKAALLALCKQHRLYQTPALNDKLYANFKGFTALGGLEPYTGLRALFLEGNALANTEGLPPLPELRCLFLQQNMLTSLSPTLAALPQLDTLNLSGNALEELGGLAGCGTLRTLLAADNQLASTAAVAPLAACPQLESLDLQNNKLEDGPALLDVLKQLPHLKCLYLRGNPLVSAMRSYRKTVIAALPGLTYLDDRPVFELERLCAEAWVQGGLEAEREARAAYLQRQMEAERGRVEQLREIREAGWRKRREALGLPLEGGDPDLEGLPQDWEGESQEGAEEEPPELRAARERLAAFTAAKQQEQQHQDEQLPELAEADMQALLEEHRENQAALQSAAGATAPAGAEQAPPSNTCPDIYCSSGPSGPPCPLAGTAQAAAQKPREVPQAAMTVRVQDGSQVGSQHQASASPSQHAVSPATAAATAGIDDEDSCSAASVADFYDHHEGEEDDCLTALD